jgi:hypothetical protein
VVYKDQNVRLCTIASAWTDVDPVDEFRQVAEDRAAFAQSICWRCAMRSTDSPNASAAIL